MNTPVRRIGEFDLIEKLGEGGMGEVYRAMDLQLEREVAIKLLRPELSIRPEVVERFRTEAVALARLNHRNIATLYSFSRHDHQYFMVLEYVRGETLDKFLLRRGALPWPEAVALIGQALNGLEHAHRLSVIHRDIKPGNLIVTTSGEIKVMDFGIARLLARARTTQIGDMVGTLEYVAPEQLQGLESDARSDLYSVATVLYEMVAGRVPFQRTSNYQLITAQVQKRPPPLRVFAHDAPKALQDILERTLAKNPEQRPASAAVLRQQLDAVRVRYAYRRAAPLIPDDAPVGQGPLRWLDQHQLGVLLRQWREWYRKLADPLRRLCIDDWCRSWSAPRWLDRLSNARRRTYIAVGAGTLLSGVLVIGAYLGGGSADEPEEITAPLAVVPPPVLAPEPLDATPLHDRALATPLPAPEENESLAPLPPTDPALSPEDLFPPSSTAVDHPSRRAAVPSVATPRINRLASPVKRKPTAQSRPAQRDAAYWQRLRRQTEEFLNR